MAYKSTLHSNRVFRDPGAITITSTLAQPIASTGTPTEITLQVGTATNFGQSGYVLIGTEQFYYTARTASALTGITRAVKGTVPATHIATSPVIQTRDPPPIAIPATSNLAGWYIDGSTNQASLRVLDSPVIQPGVIRFDVASNSFQGCTNVSPTINWATFNAQKGDQGDPGIINAILTFSNVDDPTTLTSNIGQIMKTTTIDTLDDPVPPVEVRTIVSGNTVINGHSIDTLAITQTTNEIICQPQSLPFTWSLLDTTATLKGWDTARNQAYTWASTARFPTDPANLPVAGQVVVAYTSTPGNLLTVKPLAFSAISDLNPLKVSTPFPPDLGIVGVCINSPVAGEYAVVATSGFAQIQLSATTTPYTIGIMTSSVIPYSGKLCLVNGAGFGLNIATNLSPPYPYVQIGTFLETGTITGSNAIIRLDPRIITF
jgi:hypothetical protein